VDLLLLWLLLMSPLLVLLCYSASKVSLNGKKKIKRQKKAGRENLKFCSNGRE